MGRISLLAAPSASQIKSVTVKSLALSAVTPGAASLAKLATTQKLQVERPILPPANSEAIFKGLLPIQSAQIQTQAADHGQIETLTEVDGISLDGIPYLRDGAVLLDDLPQAEPEAGPAPDAKPDEALALAFVTPPALHPEADASVDPDLVRSDQAERAYLDEREISAVRADSAASPDLPDPDRANPDRPDSSAVSSVDMRA